jgi:hypothetical protein
MKSTKLGELQAPASSASPPPTQAAQATQGTPALASESATRTVESTPKKDSEALPTFITDGIKEGLKGAAKLALKAPRGSAVQDSDRGALSDNPQNEYFSRYQCTLDELEEQYTLVVAKLGAQLADHPHALPILEAVGGAFHVAAEDAAPIHAGLIELHWVSMVAREQLGEREAHHAEGSTTPTTNLDAARTAGPRRWFGAPDVPRFDGVLDIHVDVPEGDIPLERTTAEVRSAEIIGISQEVGNRLLGTKLDRAGIPIRLVVHGHPALITRDEVGHVRVNGYLLTETGPRFSEAHMHTAATLLVDKVLSKTLNEWGVTDIKTDDATGTRPQQ